MFIQGSLMDDRTLERLQLENCRGVFVLADKLSSDTVRDDQRAMLRALAIIKYLQMYVDQPSPMRNQFPCSMRIMSR